METGKRPRKHLRIKPVHHKDDGVGVEVLLEGRRYGFVHFPPMRGRQDESAEIIVNRLVSLSRLLIRAWEHEAKPTVEMEDDTTTNND